jgi:serine protease Do
LRPGDAILAVVVGGRQTPLNSVEQFEQIVAKLRDGQALTVLVERAMGASFISLRVGK